MASENIKGPALEGLTEIIGGGVTSASGFKAAGIHSGFRNDPPGRLDMALVEAEELCTAAGTFTQNVFCSAPVQVSRAHLGGVGYGTARAVIVNSGIANAATGTVGLDRARQSAHITASALGCADDDVLVASTGVIGVQMSLDPFEDAVPALHAQATADPQGAHDAARAIMTTDTHPKEHAISYTSKAPGFEGAVITIGGMAKGSGMIMPNMATMISVLTTDAPLAPQAAHSALVQAVNRSFNKITVDSDTSTNDTCVLLASGKAKPSAAKPVPAATASAPAKIEQGTPAFDEFAAALEAVCTNLARQMAADGEGASKLITVHVAGAANDADADKAARAVANSPLVKTAVYGHDANWGRIAAALGKSGAAFQQENVNIDMLGLPVLRAGLPVAFSEDEATARFEAPEVAIDVDLGAGSAETTVWTCDFTHDYITINGDYRS